TKKTVKVNGRKRTYLANPEQDAKDILGNFVKSAKSKSNLDSIISAIKRFIQTFVNGWSKYLNSIDRDSYELEELFDVIAYTHEPEWLDEKSLKNLRVFDQ